jgi:hypothetical protein
MRDHLAARAGAAEVSLLADLRLSLEDQQPDPLIRRNEIANVVPIGQDEQFAAWERLI